MISKRQQAKLRRWVAKWKARLLLADWTVEVVYSPVPAPGDSRPGYATLAIADPIHRYATISVTVYPDFWQETEECQERTIVHELVHAPAAHTDALIQRRIMRKRVTPDEAADANERIVEYITNVAWRAYES